METEKYVLVRWPDSQTLENKRGFKSHSYLANDKEGITSFGLCAYFVEEDWYNKNK